MTVIKTILTELLGLFVDDGTLVVAVLAWVAGTALCLRGHLIDPRTGAVMLFLGIAALLAENIARSARTRGAANRKP
jgi:hypothetical protein